MDVETNKRIAMDWFAAFNDHNLNQLLTLYSMDASHYSPKLKTRQPETKGIIKGKEALRAWWHDSFIRLPTLRYEVKNLIANDYAVFMEYNRYVEGETILSVGEVLEIKNNLIISSRVYHG